MIQPAAFTFANALEVLAPALRPGERLVNGRPYTFDLDAVNAYEADRAIAAAPADLASLSAAEVSTLWSAWLNADRRRRADVDAFGRRICAERAARIAQGQWAA